MWCTPVHTAVSIPLKTTLLLPWPYPSSILKQLSSELSKHFTAVSKILLCVQLCLTLCDFYRLLFFLTLWLSTSLLTSAFFMWIFSLTNLWNTVNSLICSWATSNHWKRGQSLIFPGLDTEIIQIFLLSEVKKSIYPFLFKNRSSQIAFQYESMFLVGWFTLNFNDKKV